MSHPWKDLLVWQKAHEYVLMVYKLSSSFPDGEKYGICQQLRRAAISVAANIVEGKSRKTDKEFLSFLHTSRGSLEETRYLLLLSRDLKYIDSGKLEESEELASEVSFLLNKLIQKIR